MRVIITIIQIGMLFVFYYIGTFITQQLDIPIPGSIVGMLLLFLLLQFKLIKSKWIDNGANFLLSHLTLLFVPATVGIVQYLNFFSGRGILSIFIVLISTILVMLSSGLLAQTIVKKQGQRTTNQSRSMDV